MKNIIYVYILLIGASAYSYGQCDSKKQTLECAPRLAEGYTFIKGFELDRKRGINGVVEYSYVFTKGAKYMINICGDQGIEGLVFTIYDNARNKVASNELNGKSVRGIAYPCTSTGLYYIIYSFEKSASTCGGSAIGFKLRSS